MAGPALLSQSFSVDLIAVLYSRRFPRDAKRMLKTSLAAQHEEYIHSTSWAILLRYSICIALSWIKRALILYIYF
jgi:hypothetical protein